MGFTVSTSLKNFASKDEKISYDRRTEEEIAAKQIQETAYYPKHFECRKYALKPRDIANATETDLSLKSCTADIEGEK